MKMIDIENRLRAHHAQNRTLPDGQIAMDLAAVAKAARALKWNTHWACVKGRITGDEALGRLDSFLDDVMSVRHEDLLEAQRTLRLYLTQPKVSQATFTKMTAMWNSEDAARDELELNNPFICAAARR
jgi:hypothetical protein